MIKSLRIGTTISALAVAAALTGCAVGQQHASFGGLAVDKANMGLATRAQVALEAKQFATAVSLAERAVEHTPNDAGFRMLLGNCYFASGRFASAETAYRDSLTLLPSQPQVILKLALVEIAQGKDSEALGYLELARDSLDPADYGLAVALAGRPVEAVQVLEQAARAPEADARVRQNLALAYGLNGDWTQARTIAAQDVSPDQLEPRIQQWMQMAKPAHAYDQIAAITGIQPAADPGEPQRLALKNMPNPLERLANSAAQQEQQRALLVLADPKPAAPQPEVAEAPMPQPEVAAAPESKPAPNTAPAPIPASVVAEATKTLVQPTKMPVAPLPMKFSAPVTTPNFVAITDTVRKAAARARYEGHSNAVVQLGAYSSPEHVAQAWNEIVHRYGALRMYTPVSARFQSAKGTVYRLSVKGFASAGQAQHFCSALRAEGKGCFVRSVAGDSPVQFASR